MSDESFESDPPEDAEAAAELEVPKKKRPPTPRQVEFRGQRAFYLLLFFFMAVAVGAAWLLQIYWVNQYVVFREFEFTYSSARPFAVEMTFLFPEGAESGSLPAKVLSLSPSDRLLPYARIDQDQLGGNAPAVTRQLTADPAGRLKLTFHAPPGVEPGLYAGVFAIKDTLGRGEYRYPVSLVVRDPWALVKSISWCCLAVFLIFHAFFLWMNPTPHGELRVLDFASATSRVPEKVFTQSLEKPSWPLRWILPWRRSFVDLPDIVDRAPAGSDLQFIRRSLFTFQKRHLDVATRVLDDEDGPGVEVTTNDDSGLSDEAPDRRDFQGGTPAPREINVRANGRRGPWVCIEPNPDNPGREMLAANRRRPWLVAFQFRRESLFPDESSSF